MADTKISAMTAATLPLTGAELVPVVQSGDNRKTTVADIIAYNRAYGAWSDSTDQTGNISTGTVITYNTQDVTDGITLVNNSEITVPNTGVYDLQFSAQFKNVDNAQQEVVIWFRVNGSDLANSATIVTVPARKSASIFGYAVAAWNIFLDLNSSDYVEIFWLPSSTQLTLEHLPASVTPAYPAIPSIIVSVQQVS
jgi:hypothetical protein